MTRLILILAALLVTLTGMATHILGGEMYYTHLGNDRYEITIILYRDCGPANSNNVAFDDPVSVGIYKGDKIFKVLSVSGFKPEVLDNASSNPCITSAPGICVETAKIVTTIILPEAPEDYVIVYQRCCRSPAVGNLRDVRDYGLTLYTTIPGTNRLQEKNSSPRFKNLMPLAFCLNDIINFDHSALDPDGDSLVYGFTAPFHGADPNEPKPETPSPPPYIKVPWNTGYSDNYPIDSDPAGTIDARTGKLSLKPNRIGVYTFGVYVQEWRNGVLLSTNVRDFQFTVIACVINVEARIDTQSVFCAGLGYQFGEHSLNAEYFNWYFGSMQNPLDSSSESNPDFSFPGYGDWTVYLVINPGFSCADTTSMVFKIRDELKADIDSVAPQCFPGNSFNLRIAGNFDPGSAVNWIFPPGVSVTSDLDSVQNGVRFPAVGWNVYQVSVDNGKCLKILTDSVEVEDTLITAGILPQAEFCTGTTYTFTNSSENTERFLWDFGFTSTTDRDPMVQFPDTGVYLVKLTAGSDARCADTTTITVDIKPELQVLISMPDTVCLDSNSIEARLDLSKLPPGYTSQWTAVNGAFSESTGTSAGRNFSYSTAGMKVVEVTVQAFGCEETQLDSVYVQPNPKADFAPAFDGCVPLEVVYAVRQQYDGILNYTWILDGAILSRMNYAVLQIDSPGVYFPSLTVISRTGCLDTVTYVPEQGITVHALPPVSFELSDQRVNIDEPQVKLTSLLSDNSGMTFLFADGKMSGDSNTIYAPDNAGEYVIRQVNVSAFGCTDTLAKTLRVSGHTVYVPNTFTPDDDGINDVLIPVLSNHRRYSFQIYDRWGHLVFRTNDPGIGWNGTYREKQSPVGAYTYALELVDTDGKKQVYSGSVRLIR